MTSSPPYSKDCWNANDDESDPGGQIQIEFIVIK